MQAKQIIDYIISQTKDLDKAKYREVLEEIVSDLDGRLDALDEEAIEGEEDFI